jgi:hypothetical protein
MAIRPAEPADLTWATDLLNLAYPRPLTEATLAAILDTSDQQTVVRCDPDAPSFCRLHHLDLPANHGYPFSGPVTQVDELHPRAELDAGHLLATMAPLLSLALFDLRALVPAAGPRPVFALLPPEIAARWQPLFNAIVDGRLIWLPTLDDAIARSAPFRP